MIRTVCGEAFWLELRRQLWRKDARLAQLMGRDRKSVHVPLMLYERLAPVVRGNLAFAGEKKLPEPVSRTVEIRIVPEPGKPDRKQVLGWSHDVTSALVAVRRASPDDGDLWSLTHAPSGLMVSEFAAENYRFAAAHAARAEAGCPSVGAVDATRPETLAAFKAEFEAFARREAGPSRLTAFAPQDEGT